MIFFSWKCNHGVETSDANKWIRTGNMIFKNKNPIDQKAKPNPFNVDFGFFLGSLYNTAACGNGKTILWLKYSFDMENAGKIRDQRLLNTVLILKKGIIKWWTALTLRKLGKYSNRMLKLHLFKLIFTNKNSTLLKLHKLISGMHIFSLCLYINCSDRILNFIAAYKNGILNNCFALFKKCNRILHLHLIFVHFNLGNNFYFSQHQLWNVCQLMCKFLL